MPSGTSPKSKISPENSTEVDSIDSASAWYLGGRGAVGFLSGRGEAATSEVAAAEEPAGDAATAVSVSEEDSWQPVVKESKEPAAKRINSFFIEFINFSKKGMGGIPNVDSNEI